MPFHPNKNHSLYHFDTDLLQGVIQPEGHRHGIRKLIHKPTGLQLVHPDYALLNLYFLLTRGQCLASARAIPRTVTDGPNTIHIHWDPTPLHRASLNLTYSLAGTNAIDLTMAVRAHEVYPAYEAFVASYFDLALQPQICVSGGPYARGHQWYTPVLHELYRNNALVFPRDPESARLHRDGRWHNVRSVYLWKSEKYYAYPLALQVHPEHQIAVALMADRQACPAVCWTVGLADIKVSSYGSDHLDDPFKARNPLYLSLFGNDLEPGDQHTVRVRVAVTSLDEAPDRALDLYRTFIAEGKKPPSRKQQGGSDHAN